MKLKILGSGSIYSKDNSASYLIDNKILVDVPNGTCKILKRIEVEPNDISDVVITHFHGDHYFDMPFMLLSKITANNGICNVYCDESGENKIYNLTKLAFPNKVDKINQIFKYNTSINFSIGNYIVEKVKLEHEEGIEANGYIFKERDIKIGFTGDTGICQGIKLMAKECNYLICDCTALKGKKSHIGVDEIIDLAKKYKNCTFYTTHMGNGVREAIISLNIKNLIPLNDYDEFLI